MKSNAMDSDDFVGISLLTEFDDLVRNEKILHEGAEEHFLRFVKNSESNRTKWENSEHECQRLSIELTKASHEITGLEAKLQQARMMFDNETQSRKRAEAERDRLAGQLQTLRQLILETDGVDEGTLRRVKNIESFTVNDCEGGYGNVLSPGLMREAAYCRRRSGNLTEGSVLDVEDLSFDETVNLCESRTRSGTSFRKLNPEQREARKRSRSNSRRRDQEHVDALDERKRKRRTRSVGISEKVEILEITPRISEKSNESQHATSPVKNMSAFSSTHAKDSHDLEEKTALKGDNCSSCSRRIKFGKIYLKCRQCKVVVHAECSPSSRCHPCPPPVSPSKVSRDPSSYITRTPSKKDQRTMFASPMIE